MTFSSWDNVGKLVTKSSPRPGCRRGISVLRKPEKQGRKGFKGCHLRIDTVEIAGSSPVVPTISFRRLWANPGILPPLHCPDCIPTELKILPAATTAELTSSKCLEQLNLNSRRFLV